MNKSYLVREIIVYALLTFLYLMLSFRYNSALKSEQEWKQLALQTQDRLIECTETIKRMHNFNTTKGE